MLELNQISAGYGKAQILRQVSWQVRAGEVLCVLGRNGAGKTTTMKAIMGLLPLTGGQILLDGTVISDLPAHKVPLQGIGYVPQGRRLFGELTVAQNLEIGLRARESGPEVLEQVIQLFPRLRERFSQRSQTLSGGEQQMLATARALCLQPQVLLLDEPTEGLQPSMITAIRDVIVELRQRSVAIVLVEQRVEAVLEIADRVALIDNGRVRATVERSELRSDPGILARHLAV